MIRQSPSQRRQKIQSEKQLKYTDFGVQTQESQKDEKTKAKFDDHTFSNVKHKKRSGFEIQIFQKDLTEMNFRQRRNILKKMRDLIYSEEEANEPNNFLKQFKPNIDKVGYSKSDESIKAAIDQFKESDISTHIFLKHFMDEFVEIKDIKSSSQLLNKQLIQSMSKAITKYRGVKTREKQKCKVHNHIVEEIIYPTFNTPQYTISINELHPNEGLKNNYQINDQKELAKDDHYSKANNSSNSGFKRKSDLKRSKFPSLLLKQGEQLGAISQMKSQSSLSSSKSTNSNNLKPTKLNKAKPRNLSTLNAKSLSRESKRNLQASRKSSRKPNLPDMPLLPQRNRSESRFRSRESLRVNNVLNQKQTILERDKENMKIKQKQNSKKLRKRGGSINFDQLQQKRNRKSFQIA